MNYFEFYSMPEAFAIDKALLRKKFLENSRNFHPDFAKARGMNSEEALEQSSINNKAYKTLSDESLRRSYLLELKGVLGQDKEQLPMDFLMEMMDLNETVSEFDEDTDNESLKSALLQIEELENEINESLKAAQESYDKNQDEGDLKRVKEFHLKSKYILRIKKSIDTFAAL